MRLLASLLLFGLLAGGLAERKSYSGYQVLETDALDSRAARALSSQSQAWDFWLAPIPGRPARILVAPEEIRQVQRVLESQGIAHSVIVDDVQRSLDENGRSQDIPQHHGRAISFNKFNRLAEIHGYLDELAAQYPGLVEVQSIGRSLEGRDLKLVKISSGGGRDKPAIFIDAAIHAREWIAPPVALYTIQQLVENYTANRELVDSVDWYILPVLNPDGYEYTHTNERLWRKTRSNNGNPICLGVDANRNFDFHWAEIGASLNQCSQTFAGPRAQSEPEAAALAQFLLTSGANVQLYLTLHSYGQLLLYPWGHTSVPPGDARDLESLGQAAAAALQAVRGTRYTVGGSSNVLYSTSGSSQDWAKGQAGIKYSYTLELPAGGSGFDPPPSAIIPVVQETFEAIKVFGAVIGGTKKI